MGRRRGSYKFEKRQRELAKKKKKQEKLERRQNRAEDEPPGEERPLLDVESAS